MTSDERNADATAQAPPLLRVEDLRTYFHTRAGVARAVDGVSFGLGQGETLGIVGESGSGKSVACYSLLRLIPEPPGRIESGRALFHEFDLLHCNEMELRAIRGDRIAMIFQDPMTSLNPYLRIGDQVIEPLLIHGKATPNDAFDLGVAALREVGIQDAAQRMRSYPHEFSGGMRQRVMIATALITKPELLLADEPTTALDVTVQAQILELIGQLQKERGTAVVFVTHDIGVVSAICDRVLVMYAGRILESGPTAALLNEPKHPYTQALERSIPALQPPGSELRTIPGKPPDVTQPIRGCPFAARCEFALEKCVTSEIALREVGPGQTSACLRVQLGEIELAPGAGHVARE